jgi:hypothetical protein
LARRELILVIRGIVEQLDLRTFPLCWGALTRDCVAGLMSI